jgi:anaerobic selenocysteine-containing dehydrogenase
MHVTVEDGRAIKVAGAPDHPITAGFLCGKVSNYLDRVYSPERILHPLVREGPKGAGRFRRASWDEALDLVAGALARARAEHGGESILPYSYYGTQGTLQAELMSARLMNALGASELVRTICATAGMVGCASTHGFSPEVDPEEWPHARYLLVWAWNPMSTAPHLWRKLLEARRAGARLVVVDPFRSRTARVADEHLRPLPGTDAALAMGMMRAVLDRSSRTRTGAGRTPMATASCSSPSRAIRSSAAPRSAGSTPRPSHALAASSRARGPRCCGLAWAASATRALPPPTPPSRLCRR